MAETIDLGSVKPDHVFEGGDLDCGSGLILLIRENMCIVPEQGILEMRSREPTVKNDLPPWCRMVGHGYLGSLEGEGFTRYFIRRSLSSADEAKNLEKDKTKAKEYAWKARARSTGHLKSTVYCRNFSIEVGQPASFEESDKHPSAIEYLLSALAGDLVTGFSTECAKSSLKVDDIEMTISGKLHNILAHLGLEEGDPSVASIELKCFASTFEDEAKVREAWERTVRRSPLAVTLGKAVDIKTKLAIL
jgi:uncharacterized OsmC-like protein